MFHVLQAMSFFFALVNDLYIGDPLEANILKLTHLHLVISSHFNSLEYPKGPCLIGILAQW